MNQSQIVSKKRVADHGEVLTGDREVGAMLNLVVRETERIESRFLEPACGNGNFMASILDRKLKSVEKLYARSQSAFELYAVIAISSLYGIDILKDNVEQCRLRLYNLFKNDYIRIFASEINHQCSQAVRFILGRNIVWGDTLTLKTAGKKPTDIIFSEWTPVRGSMLRRRDFKFHELLTSTVSPKPQKEYSPIHFMEIFHEQR